MNQSHLHLLAAGAIVLAGFTSTGCSRQFGYSSAADASSLSSTPAGTSGNPANVVCNPLGTTTTTSSTQGLSANLYDLSQEPFAYNDVADYIAHGTQVDTTLYFSQVNVPTTYFSDGFTARDGTLLTNAAGTELFEWFALQFQSQIALGPNDTAGKYQFALMSDDGSVFSLDQGSGFQTVVNNDGTHSSQLECGTTTVQFDSTTRMPMQLEYYQGPRYYIAVMLLWRQIPDSENELADPSVLQDPACGQIGDETFFTSPTAPTATWVDMLNRGWKVLVPQNFYLPSTTPVNPCS